MRQTSMTSAVLETVIPASEQLQTNAVDRATAGIGVYTLGDKYGMFTSYF
jgi:hypothetical protein